MGLDNCLSYIRLIRMYCHKVNTMEYVHSVHIVLVCKRGRIRERKKTIISSQCQVKHIYQDRINLMSVWNYCHRVLMLIHIALNCHHRMTENVKSIL